MYENAKAQAHPAWEPALQQYAGGGIQGGAVKDRNPESLPSRMNQLISGLDNNVRMASSIRGKLFGFGPEQTECAGNNLNQMEPPVMQQVEMLQGRVTELAAILESILTNF